MKTVSGLAALLLVGLCALLTGCSDSNRQEPSAAQPPVEEKEHMKVELQPEGTPELVRRVYYNRFDEKLRAEIEFRDGSVGGEVFHGDGKVKERWRNYPHSKQELERTTYAPDGETMVTSVTHHKNGRVHKDTRLQKDGGYRLVENWDTGIIMTELLVRKDGSAERLSYSSDGKYVDRKTVVLVGGEVDSWDCEADGRVTSHSHWQKNGNQDVTYFRVDGSASHRQWWHILRNFDTTSGRAHRGWILDKVEEYDSDGKTLLRRILLAPGPKDVNPVARVEVFRADGSRTVRHLNGEKVQKEEVFSAAGKLQHSETFADGKEPVEKVDAKLLECWHVIGHKFDSFD